AIGGVAAGQPLDEDDVALDRRQGRRAVREGEAALARDGRRGPEVGVRPHRAEEEEALALARTGGARAAGEQPLERREHEPGAQAPEQRAATELFHGALLREKRGACTMPINTALSRN